MEQYVLVKFKNDQAIRKYHEATMNKKVDENGTKKQIKWKDQNSITKLYRNLPQKKYSTKLESRTHVSALTRFITSAQLTDLGQRLEEGNQIKQIE